MSAGDADHILVLHGARIIEGEPRDEPEPADELVAEASGRSPINRGGCACGTSAPIRS